MADGHRGGRKKKCHGNFSRLNAPLVNRPLGPRTPHRGNSKALGEDPLSPSRKDANNTYGRVLPLARVRVEVRRRRVRVCVSVSAWTHWSLQCRQEEERD